MNLNVHYDQALSGEAEVGFAKRLSLYFEVRNLFDRVYTNSAQNLADSISGTNAEASDGAVLRVCNMEDFLREMDVDPAIVADVAQAEAVNLGGAAGGHNAVTTTPTIDSSHQSLTEIPISFDYSKNDGFLLLAKA